MVLASKAEVADQGATLTSHGERTSSSGQSQESWPRLLVKTLPAWITMLSTVFGFGIGYGTRAVQGTETNPKTHVQGAPRSAPAAPTAPSPPTTTSGDPTWGPGTVRLVSDPPGGWPVPG